MLPVPVNKRSVIPLLREGDGLSSSKAECEYKRTTCETWYSFWTCECNCWQISRNKFWLFSTKWRDLFQALVKWFALLLVSHLWPVPGSCRWVDFLQGFAYDFRLFGLFSPRVCFKCSCCVAGWRVLLLFLGWVQTGRRKCHMQRCSSVIRYMGLSITPCFCFISWCWYHPTRSACRLLLFPKPLE